GRTTHSLVYALARFGANVVTLAANGMELPQYVIERLQREYQYSLAPVASDDLRAVVTETDALYLTPKQPHQLALFTQVDSSVQSFQSPDPVGPQCSNANCITVTEPGSATKKFEVLSNGPGGALLLRCSYCDHRFKVQLIGHAKSKRYCAYDISLADTLKDWLKKHELAIFNSIKEAE